MAKRKTLYRKIEFENEPIIVEKAKELLGWEEVDDKSEDYLFHDKNKKKIRCTNNVRNRPIYRSVLNALQQEHLKKRWQLKPQDINCEPIIIGRTGLLLNGQHSLISLVLAVQEWENRKDKWPAWKKTPFMAKLIVYGCSEDDKIVNTMDTCKPRSLADVVYRSNYFDSLSDRKERRHIARIADYAVRILWERTGGADAFTVRRTHAEALNFIERHPRLLRCVEEIHKLDKNKRLSRHIGGGYAAGLLYLMATSTSDEKKYIAIGCNESVLKWTHWTKAKTFWRLLSENTDTQAKRVVAKLAAVNENAQGPPMKFLACVCVLAWNRYVDDKPIRDRDLALPTDRDDTGRVFLEEYPVVGGIDFGCSKDAVEHRTPEIPEEELEERSTVERTKRKPKLVPRRNGKCWAAGDVAWVEDADEVYLGELLENPFKCDDGDIKVSVRSKDGEWEVSTSALTLAKPVAAVPCKCKPWPSVGALVWVVEEDDSCWQGKILTIEDQQARLEVATGHRGAGNSRWVSVACLQRNQPEGG
jgi:hypothetical protein